MLFLIAFYCSSAYAQGTAADYERANGLKAKYEAATVDIAGDNHMDKIWWNEQWMGWPIGPQYSASSNVDNAYRLQGDVLLVVGEMDTNVDPSSTMQVVSQLIKHNKNFRSAGRSRGESWRRPQ